MNHIEIGDRVSGRKPDTGPCAAGRVLELREWQEGTIEALVSWDTGTGTWVPLTELWLERRP